MVFITFQCKKKPKKRATEGSYHVSDARQLINHRVRPQLNLTDDACQESCNLIEPPLQTIHQHAGEGQHEERTPLLQAVY